MYFVKIKIAFPCFENIFDSPSQTIPFKKIVYINFPAPIAEACEIVKGEEMEWQIQDRNTFVLRRKKKAKSFVKK